MIIMDVWMLGYAAAEFIGILISLDGNMLYFVNIR